MAGRGVPGTRRRALREARAMGHRTLRLSGHPRAGQQAVRTATRLAYLEHDDPLAEPAAEHDPDPATRTPPRIGLARQVAAVPALPYGDLHTTADRYGRGVETVTHRLSTLERPSAPEAPFSFPRPDHASSIVEERGTFVPYPSGPDA